MQNIIFQLLSHEKSLILQDYYNFGGLELKKTILHHP